VTGSANKRAGGDVPRPAADLSVTGLPGADEGGGLGGRADGGGHHPDHLPASQPAPGDGRQAYVARLAGELRVWARTGGRFPALAIPSPVPAAAQELSGAVHAGIPRSQLTSAQRAGWDRLAALVEPASTWNDPSQELRDQLRQDLDRGKTTAEEFAEAIVSSCVTVGIVADIALRTGEPLLAGAPGERHTSDLARYTGSSKPITVASVPNWLAKSNSNTRTTTNATVSLRNCSNWRRRRRSCT